MSSDLERIRALAQMDKNERIKKINEARGLARKHLSLWVTAIEKAIYLSGNVGGTTHYFYCKERPKSWFSTSMHICWTEDSSDLAPQIDLDEIVAVPVEALIAYTTELTSLLGEPFSVSYDLRSYTAEDGSYAYFRIQCG